MEYFDESKRKAGRGSTSDKLRDVHYEALREFDEIQSTLREERMQCLSDRRFYSIAGAQWEGDLGEQFENKPKFEVNKLHLAIIRIINEYRNNRVTVDFVSKAGMAHDKLADTCDALYRAAEQESGAEEAYDNAFEEAVSGGFGAWRLRTAYEDEEDEDDDRQVIRIEPIFDADSTVFFDLDAKRQDKADAMSCYVLTPYNRSAYVRKYGDDPASWNKDISRSEFDWTTPDSVYVAEYYKKEDVSEYVYTYRHQDGKEEKVYDSQIENDESLIETLEATGAQLLRKKKVKRPRVHKYILSGGGVLEDCGIIAGKHIPIVPVYGKRWYIDNIERCAGHVRFCKDAQRLKNMQLSKLGELSAQASNEKPIFTPEQIAGHQEMWSDDNIQNYPYLLVNPMTDAAGNPVPSGPVAYTKPPAIPQAMATLLQVTEQDMQDLLGNPGGGEIIQPNISAKAVEMIQGRLDMQAYIYMSNLKKAIKRSGEIWLSMARDVFVEEGRVIRGVGAAGEVAVIELLRPIINEKGIVEYENDLAQAKFDVSVEVGPSSSSRRASTVRAITGLLTMTQDPETAQILSSMAIMNMEGEGIGELRNYYRTKLIRMGAIKPTEEEAKVLEAEAANAQPDPQQQYMLAAAKEAEGNAMAAMADVELKNAKAVETKAKVFKIASEIDQMEYQQALDMISQLGVNFQSLGAGASPEMPAQQAPIGMEPPPQGGGLQIPEVADLESVFGVAPATVAPAGPQLGE